MFKMHQGRSFESYQGLADNKIPEDRTSIFRHYSVYFFYVENVVPSLG
jgi:hypothetical protein